jgi:hypothetical protein
MTVTSRFVCNDMVRRALGFGVDIKAGNQPLDQSRSFGCRQPQRLGFQRF